MPTHGFFHLNQAHCIIMARKIALLYCLILGFQASNFAQNFQGIWEGNIDAGGTALLIRFNITETDGLLMATLDVPLQGAKGLPSNGVSTDGRDIRISFSNMGIEYAGVMNEEASMIEGKWIQGGQNTPLSLSKKEKVTQLNRPQEPRPPFPYKAVDVQFHSPEDTSVILAGTLTIPEGEGPFPVVILVSGSGGQNRDEEILGHKPFLVLADFLSRRDVAVLRYDDRGIAGSSGVFQTSTTLDFAKDALGALQYLRRQNHFSASAYGVIGHSEGGIIAQMLPSLGADPDFLILLAAPGRKGMDIIAEQNAYVSLQAGNSKEVAARDSIFAYKLFQMVPSPDSGEKVDQVAVKAHLEAYYHAEKERLVQNYATFEQFYFSQSSLTGNPWFKYYLHLDPASYTQSITCPVLALNGSLDGQVHPVKDLGKIEKALSGKNASNRFVVMENLNHLFQYSETGSPSEYGVLEETLNPEVMTIIDTWLRSLGY